MQIGHGSHGVIIGEYGCYRVESPDKADPAGMISDGDSNDQNKILGWIEPAAVGSPWIGWFTKRGDFYLYVNREDNGAVVGDPIRIFASGEVEIPDSLLNTNKNK